MENDVVSSTDLQSSKEGPSYDLKDTTNRKSVLESIERSENIIQNDEYEGNDSAYSAGEESGRHFTVYDAVAERVGMRGFLDPKAKQLTDAEELTDRWIDLQSFPPEAILLEEEGVPSEYRGDDIERVYEKWYQDLPPQLSHPDSDLLHAIHAYVADFYSVMPNGECGIKSMDGTALLAMGILLEEMAAEVIGETGQLAFLESERMYRGGVPTFWNGIREVPIYYEGNQLREKRMNRRTSRELSSAQESDLTSKDITGSENGISDEENLTDDQNDQIVRSEQHKINENSESSTSGYEGDSELD